MRLEDGFPTLVSFSAAPAIFGNPAGDLWIKRITPPGYDGGGPIPDTSMHNTVFRTQYPKYLVTVTDATLMVSFDPRAYQNVLPLINLLQLFEYAFPAGETLTIPGWVNTFVPNEFTEGVQPEATMQLCHSMQTVNTDLLVEDSVVFVDV